MRKHRQILITTGGVAAAGLTNPLAMKLWQDHRRVLDGLKGDARLAEYEERL